MADDLFVGRVGELSLLKNLLVGVINGVGGAVLVEGEQGIGKTALLRQAVGEAGGAGCALRWAAADELRRGLPLGRWPPGRGAAGQAARGRRAGADDPGAGGAEPALGGGLLAGAAWLVPTGDPVAAGVERLLAQVDRLCAVSPVVLVAEDLQWADEASLLVWQRLASAVRQLPLLLAGSWRPGPGRDELGRLRRGLGARGGTVLSLGPLAPREFSQLAGRLAGGRPGRRLAGVVRRAGGNPLYARELVDALVREGQVRVAAGVAELVGPGGPGGLEVPASLAAAIGARLGALRPQTAGVLRWAAVLGQEFTVADLAVVTGQSAGQLVGVIEEAMTAGVVGETADAGVTAEGTGAGPRLAFRHGLIRQVLYDGMPQPLRQASHLQAAQALAAVGAAPERVAAQVTAAPEPTAAQPVVAPEAGGEWLLGWLASIAPVLTYRAPAVAAMLLRGALSQIPDGDPRREGLEIALVTVAFLLGQAEEVERVARPLLARTADPDRAAQAAWLLAYTLSQNGRTSEAAAVAETALARPGISGIWASRLLARQAMTMNVLGQRDDAAELGGQALADAERAGDRFAAGYALHALSTVAYHRRDHAAYLRHIDRALALIGDDPQTSDLRLLLLSNRTGMLEDLDRRDEAGATIRQALDLAEKAGTPRLATICVAAAEHYFVVGQWDDALAVLETATASPGFNYIPYLHGLVALIAGHRDDRAMAEEHLTVAPALDFAPHLTVAHRLFAARAMAAEQAGRPEEALAVLAPCLEPPISDGMPDRHVLLPTLTRLALAAGQAATTGAAAQAAADEAAREPTPFRTAVAGYCRGLANGDPAPVLAAADYYKSAGRPPEHAQALEDAAVLLAARSDLPAARQALGDAAALYRDLGAEWDLRRAAGRLRGYGIRPGARGPQARPTRGWDALTPTETKIAYHVARGQSNPDIAAELWLSRNTVQNHISHILAKLGARSRAEIVREALDHQPAGQNAPPS